MKKNSLLIFAVLFIICSVDSRAQNTGKKKKTNLDSIKVKAGHFFVIEKDAYYVARDTVFVVPDTLHCYQKKHSLNSTNEFYNSLVNKLSSNKYSSLLYTLLFEKDEQKLAEEKAAEKSNFEESKERYLKYDGATVNQINLKKLKVFGTNVEDTTKLETSIITKTINGLHIATSDKIIQQNLIVRKGSVIRADELADNERLIRKLDYIKDARIYVAEGSSPEEANLYVVTRDLFPLKFDYSTDAETTTSSIGISNINIFGTGHENENNIIIDDIGENSIGYDGYYLVRNIGGSFVTGELNYVTSFANHGYGIKLYRNFYTPDIEYAGGVEFSSKNHNQFRAFDNVTDSITIISHKEVFQDVWFARSFKTLHVPSILKNRERLRFIVSGRITRRNFMDSPEVQLDYNQAFHDRTNMLIGVGLSSRGYYKDRLIRNFGRTEDIPVGTSLQLTTGYQIGEFFNREYIGIEFAEGEVLKKFGYIKGTFKLGGFFRHKTLEQGVLKMRGEYFSRLHTWNLFKYRQFVTVDYTKGIRRKEQDYIDINDANGIRGLYNFFLTGTERFVVNTESVIFTPFYVGGFRTAFLAFFDFGLINTTRGRDSYYGAGFGLRLKNDNLAFNTIQFRLGFYPSVPFQGASRSFNFSTIGNLELQDFDISSPQIIQFR
ncbi:hypothetical protein [Reichenbachiella sp. MALMAid0571]|uniref:hypothetical protein n=1 Tax=Reichenbachiella sp. MALMAid0571 TaxID=3143939 RepID=UPI0032E04328